MASASIFPTLIAAVKRPEVLLFAACVLAFAAYPQIDLVVASYFYTPAGGFYLANNPLVQLLYQVFARIHFLVLGLLLLSWIGLRYLFNGQRKNQAKPVLFLILLLVVGPGLVVNGLLKEHWGRARPREVVEFGGTKTFTPALQPTNQCETNCSFVSGHAAMGFFPIGIAWVAGRRRWLVVGLFTGALVGAGRMLQGGHFLADVIFAFWAVYLSARVLAYLMGLKTPQPTAQPSAA